MKEFRKYHVVSVLIAIVLIACSPKADPIPTATSTATSTKVPTQTPSFEEWFSENIEIEHFELFNAAEDSDSQRDYSDSFEQSEAMVIHCEFDFDHPDLENDKSMVMEATYFGPDGDMFGRAIIEPTIEKGWASSNWVVGYGWDLPGKWEAGEYLVEIQVDGYQIASKSFTIVAATPTPTPQPFAIVDTRSLNIRRGPGTVYGVETSLAEGDLVEVIGMAYDCEWLKVRTMQGAEGWVSKDLVIYDIPCSEIPAASIPATPIPPPPTETPVPVQEKKEQSGPTVKIPIQNNTGGSLTLTLSGPAQYSFTLGPGKHTITVVKGTYNFTAYGCGGASDSGSRVLKSGIEWEWFCN